MCIVTAVKFTLQLIVIFLVKSFHVCDCSAEFEEFEVKPTIFPYNQLRTATRDFHPDTKLGQGAFGAVYKVML